MRKDDLLGNSPHPLPQPPLIRKHLPLLESYARHCRAAIDIMFTHLERGLELPQGTLLNLHRMNERSGDHIRFNKSAPGAYDEAKVRLGEHTDFGTQERCPRNAESIANTDTCKAHSQSYTTGSAACRSGIQIPINGSTSPPSPAASSSTWETRS